MVECLEPTRLAEEFNPDSWFARLRRTRLGNEFEGRAEAAALRLAWQVALRPVGGEFSELLDVLAGDGISFSARGRGPTGEWSLIAHGRDGDLAQDCIEPLLGWAGIEASMVAGESWKLPFGKFYLQREGDVFVAAPTERLLKEALAGGWTKPEGYARARREMDASGIFFWLDGEVMRRDGFEEHAEDAGAAFLFGDLHESLLHADWLAGGFSVRDGNVALKAFTPASPTLEEQFAPYFPPQRQLELPDLDDELGLAVLSRDLGVWWTSRDQYLAEDDFAESIESDGNMSLLFGRDAGVDVFQHLEPEMSMVFSSLPVAESARLSVEFPASAMMMRIKPGHRQELGPVFATAFLSAVSFINFEKRDAAAGGMLLDNEDLADGKLYTARFPETMGETTELPIHHNLSPALWISPNGEVWLSSSTAVLRNIAHAKRQTVQSGGVWAEMRGQQASEILERNRAGLQLMRLLTAGKGEDEASRFVDTLIGSAAILDTVRFESRRVDDLMCVQLQLHPISLLTSQATAETE